MKLNRMYGLNWLIIFIPLFFFILFIAQPLPAADEKTTKEALTEELPPGEAEEGFTDRLLFIADFDAFITRSSIHGSGSVEGGSVNGLFAPVYQMNDRTFFILMYDGHYYKEREFFSDDIGPRERREFQSHTIEPMVRFDFGERTQYSLTPSVFHTVTYNKDVDTTGWSDGLYNYRDYGAGLDFDMRGVYGDEGTLSFGAQYYYRKYPNYASLLNQAITWLDLSTTGANTEPNEKDYHGVIAKAGYSWVKPLGFSWETQYSLLYKRLLDKKVVDSNGVLTSDEQRDYLQRLDVNFKYMMDVGGGLKFGLDLNGSLNDSNQNYWDEQIVGLFSSQQYTGDYYDYFSYKIRPNIAYTFALIPLTPSVSYSYYRIEYDNRKAKYSNRDYKGEEHYETQDEIALGLRYDLTDNWSIMAQYQNLVQRSNNDDQSVYRYDYIINNYSIGVAFKY